jgi:hypothetical protein
MDDPTSQVIALVNGIRARHGLAPLVVSPELTASAQNYAAAMGRLSFFGHQGPDGSRLDTRDEAAGYLDWTFLAENLAAGQPTAQQAVAAWVASPSHYADILSWQAHETGVGFALAPGSKYVFYWVQEFGDRDSFVYSVELPASGETAPRAATWPFRADIPGLDSLGDLPFAADPRLLLGPLATTEPDRAIETFWP